MLKKCVMLVMALLAPMAISDARAQATASAQFEGGGGGGGGQGGNLIYKPYCQGWGVWEGDYRTFIEIVTEMYADGQLVGSPDTTYGLGYAESPPLYEDLPAKANDQEIVCYVYLYVDGGLVDYGMSEPITAPGAGPAEVRVTAAAFISKEWVYPPHWSNYIYGGDDRSFSESGTARIRNTVTVRNPAISDQIYGAWAAPASSPTREYEYESSIEGFHLTPEAKADNDPGEPWMTREETASPAGGCTPESLGANIDGPSDITSRLKLTCWFSGPNPLVPFSPTIDMEFEILFRFGMNQAEYIISGCNDGYPNYEIFLNGTHAYGSINNGNLMSLYAPCDVTINATGSIGGGRP